MKKIAFLCAAASLGLGAVATAGEYWAPSKQPVKEPYAPVEDCFYAGEMHFDLISMYVDPSGDGLDDGFGGGIGLGYFFTENIGLMGRAYWWDTDSVIHSITASIVARYPIQDLCIAPYVYGGIGGHFDSVNQVGGHLGAGAEYRLTDSVGIFADYSYTWADETDDWHGYSLGLRFVF